MGSLTYRHTRPMLKKLGKPSKVTKAICKMLCSPSRNPVRKQPYKTQIAYHKIPVKKRQLQNKLKEHIKGGDRYKCAFIKKVISAQNYGLREAYGQTYLYDPLFGFFNHIVYIDKAHVDPTSQAQGMVLREQGTRDDLENIEERPPLKGVRFHIAAWISWWGKADKLEFYNDEEDTVERLPYPSKPRKRPTIKTKEEFEYRVTTWEAGKSYEREVKVKGNAMTQKYYVNRLLPIYVKAMESIRLIDDKPWLLQEDGDPSHGMRKRGLTEEYKEAHDIQNLSHLTQSLDLNPIEAIWNIIKQRLRWKIFDFEEEMKEALQEEWDKITMDEIRFRIADMPRRCAELVKCGKKPIRGNKW
jgi:hypothetical protein